MAVGAYAAVVSLMHVLDQIKQYPPPHLHLDRNQIETLHKKVSSLQDFLEGHSQRFYEDLEDLATQIAGVAREAEDIVDSLMDESDIDLSFFWKLVVVDEREDIIESHGMDQLHKASADKSDMDLSFHCGGIDNVIERIDSIKKELMTIREGRSIQEQRPRVFVPASSSTPPSGGDNTMVGFDKQFNRIMDELIEDKCGLQVLPIVGMGGIGKTTLARTAFENLQRVQRFDIYMWVTISQDYSMEKVLLGLLHDKEKGDKKCNERDESLAKLGDRLYKKLYDRRYLVVIDDVWSTELWNGLRSFFPENSNQSRIMVTTRLLNVAVSFSSRNLHKMDFLGDKQSWNLFCKKAFGEKRCPPELEEVGKSIAKSCKGLPLAIVVIGGLLSKSNMTREYWESVAKYVNSLANSADDGHCLKILSLSYKNLPIHLKPCFLFFRKFPEDHEVSVSELIRLWVAEGFPKPIKGKTLEEIAYGYLKDLTERNLILIQRFTSRGRMKSCGIHDLLRDLCTIESRKENFYCVPKVQEVRSYSNQECFLCAHLGELTEVHLPQVAIAMQSTLLATRLVCDNCIHMYPQLHRLRWVKGLKSNEWHYGEDILVPNKLRYLTLYSEDYRFVGNLIHLLWNLQTIVIPGDGVVLPSKIWELPQLRHVRNWATVLPSPPPILENLQTLSTIRNFKWPEDANKIFPNLKTLRIDFYPNPVVGGSRFSLHNLDLLCTLESLSLEARELHTLKNISFPRFLKKLSLGHCNIPWEEMWIISLLSYLEVLRLYQSAFEGPEWILVEEKFLQLKILSISSSFLMRWEAKKIHFPKLEHLKLGYMRFEKIPFEIGGIETLCSITLNHCAHTVVSSAKEILDEQRSFGNEELQLYVDYNLVLPGSG